MISGNIIIDPSFEKEVQGLLQQIDSTPTGRKLLEKINKCWVEIYIHPDKNSWMDISYASPMIFFNLNNGKVFDRRGNAIEQPSHIALAHELIHAYHWSKPWKDLEVDEEIWCSPAEHHVIMGKPRKGWGWLTQPKISENTIRKEHGLPERFSHLSYDPKLQWRIFRAGLVHSCFLSLKVIFYPYR